MSGFQGDGGVLVEVDGDDGNLYENAKLSHLHNLHTVDFPTDTSITFEARGEGWNNLILRTFPGGRYVYIKKTIACNQVLRIPPLNHGPWESIGFLKLIAILQTLIFISFQLCKKLSQTELPR